MSTILTLRAGTTRTVTQRFITSPITPFTVAKSNPATPSMDVKVCQGCFKTGDSISLCASSGCSPTQVSGTCPDIISITYQDKDGCQVMTINNASLPLGSTGGLYTIPKLKGMWLSASLIPNKPAESLTGSVRSMVGSPNYVIEDPGPLTIGHTLVSADLTGGASKIVAIRHMQSGSGRCFALVTLDKPALIEAVPEDYKVFQISPKTPINVVGARASTSMGQATCGALSIDIPRDVSTAVASWGDGHVGSWKLLLNNGYSEGSPVTSHILAEGELWVA